MTRLFGILLVFAAACGSNTVVNGVKCSSDSDCKLSGASGTCQVSAGFCAYPDATCEGGSRYTPGAGDLSSTCVGGPGACGAKDQACCASNVCGADLACTNNTCSCGVKDGPCCGGTTCGANLTCEASTTTCGCGAYGEACCGGSTCDTGLACNTGTCSANPISVAVGKGHMCVLFGDHTVWCWGHDEMTFGSSTPVHRAEFVAFGSATRVPMLTDVAELRAGDYASCARKSDNTLWCWGHGEAGQLGNGTSTGSFAPVQVAGLTNVTAFDVGRMHACAIGTVGGTTGVYCWGRGGTGTHSNPASTPGNSRIGNGGNLDAPTPAAVDLTSVTAAGQTATAIATGGYASCLAASDNTVWCWGSPPVLPSNTSVPVAIDLSQITIPVGVTIASITMAQGVSNNGSACMRLSDDTVYCWGQNNYGQAGIGGTGATPRPATAFVTTSLAGATIKAIASAQDARIVLDSNGAVWAVGRNQAGELGINDTVSTGSHATLTHVTGLTGVLAIGANHHTACAIDGTHQLFCWGNNRRGQISKSPPLTNAGGTLFQPTLVPL